MSNTVKSKFAGLFRGFFRRSDKGEETPAPPQRPVTTAAPGLPAYVQPNPKPALATNPSAAANEIALPLAPIIASLPMELRAKIMSVPAPGRIVNLPVETVMSQLAFGMVKISFGDLRRLAPGVFSNSGGEYDNKVINLPLSEILPRMNPALLARSDRKKVEVDEDISGPFGGRGDGITFTSQPLKATTPPPPPAPKIPAAPMPTFAPPSPRMTKPAVSTPPPAPAAPIAFAPPPGFSRSLSPASNGNGHHLPPLSSAPKPPNPAASVPPPVPVMPRPEPAQLIIVAVLRDLAEHWPAELQDEISREAFANESVSLAGALVEAGLKRGRVTMAWKQLRTLAKPTSPVSPNDHLELELPLKVIAPLFFAAQKNLLRTQKKASVSEEIPNLFFGFPQAAPEPVAPVPRPVEKKSADSNYFVRNENGVAPKNEEVAYLPPPMPQTDFTSRHAPPKEVVARALALPGVAGAVVTLPDGLRVASEVPVEFNADTLAAFIPQLFERMNQSVRELRMGALNNVSFTVGQVPWRIFRVNAVYLAAFGRAGEPLPTAQLAALAGELDRKQQTK